MTKLVLLGHSFGGVTVRLFAGRPYAEARYPGLLSGTAWNDRRAALRLNPGVCLRRAAKTRSYLYGPMNNVYREAFVFDCARDDRKFYLPGDGSMKLQFFHVDDLCRFMEILLERHPAPRVFNVGNPQTVTVREWAALCYEAAGAVPDFAEVETGAPQRDYFCFHDYGYELDVSRQCALLPDAKLLREGLREALAVYQAHPESVYVRKPYMEYIDKNFSAVN